MPRGRRRRRSWLPRRVAGLTEYLGGLRYVVAILSSAISGGGPLGGTAQVVHTTNLIASSLNSRPRHFAALTGQATPTSGRRGRAEQVVKSGHRPGWLAPLGAPACPRALPWTPFRCRRFDLAALPRSHFVDSASRCQGNTFDGGLARAGRRSKPPHAAWPLRLGRRADRWLEARFSEACGCRGRSH